MPLSPYIDAGQQAIAPSLLLVSAACPQPGASNSFAPVGMLGWGSDCSSP